MTTTRLVLLATFLCTASITVMIEGFPGPQASKGCHLMILSASNRNEKGDKVQGVYVRPSAAVERGSGFFFPGLEGPRVRLVTGTVLLAVTCINHILSSSTSRLSEALAVSYSLLVLFQGLIESSKETRIETLDVQAKNQNDPSLLIASRQELSQQWSTSPSQDERWNKSVEWAAASFLSLTPATHMILLKQDGKQQQPRIEYLVGVTGIHQDANVSAINSALIISQKSKGGRVALPSNHPTVVELLPKDFQKCVILQRITSESCWMVASNDLLASFTKQDLQWLGQLAKYVVPTP